MYHSVSLAISRAFIAPSDRKKRKKIGHSFRTAMSTAAEKGSDDQSKFKTFIGMLCGSINDEGDKRYEDVLSDAHAWRILPV